MSTDDPQEAHLESVPLSPRARELFEQNYKPRLAKLREQIAQTSLVILVWGPGPSMQELYAKRVQIRDELRRRNHAAFFSEEVTAETGADLSLKSSEFVQALGADLVVVLQVSPGSIAEVHDFSDYRAIHGKFLIYIPDTTTEGYSVHGALSELKRIYNNVEMFNVPKDLRSCALLKRVLEKVAAMQIMKWRASLNAESWGL